MEDFNKKYAEAFQKAGLSVIDSQTGNEMSKDEFADFLNAHTIYEIEGMWYTRDSIFTFGKMDDEYANKFKGNTMITDEIAFYMLNDCWVSGLCIIRAEGKYGIFPLKERTGDQSGIWSAKDYPFIYDDVQVFADWEKWDDYGYVAAKKESGWGVIKVTQFPDPAINQVVGFEYASSEEAMKAGGIDFLPIRDCFVRKI